MSRRGAPETPKGRESSTSPGSSAASGSPGVQQPKLGHDECATAASEILLSAAEVWRYHWKRRRAVLRAVGSSTLHASKGSRSSDGHGNDLDAPLTRKQHVDNLVLFQDDLGGTYARDGTAAADASLLGNNEVPAPNGADGGSRTSTDQNTLVVSLLLEAHYYYHRHVQQLLDMRGRQMSSIIASQLGATAGTQSAVDSSPLSGHSVLPFRINKRLAVADALSTDHIVVDDPLDDIALDELHRLAVALVAKYQSRLIRSAGGSTSAGGNHNASFGASGSSRLNMTISSQVAPSHASSDELGSGSAPESDGVKRSVTASIVEGLLLLDSVDRGVGQSATLSRSRSTHVIDLEHCVMIRLWKERREARAFHRGLAALHEAKCMLMLPPSFAVPYSVLLKGAKNTAISVTWLPPLESSHVVQPPKVYTNFTYFVHKAWREAVYPNVEETRSTAVSLCSGADGVYYAVNTGMDDALTSAGAGGMIIDDGALRSPSAATSAGSPRLPNGSNSTPVVLFDARRHKVESKSPRHYLQARQMFQRVSVQLKTSYETHVMYLSMVSYLHGSLFAASDKSLVSVSKAVEAVIEFATNLPKEETPLAVFLYTISGELRRLSTLDYVKRMAKKIVNTTLFQPKLTHWQLDTRVVSDLCALTVTHILEGRDDPVSLKKNLETKRIANIAIVDVCSVWGMCLADAEVRYGHTRTLALFAKAAFEIVLVDHATHYVPPVGVRPPKAVAADATSDDNPLATEVAEVAYGVLQPMLLGIDAKLVTTALSGSGAVEEDACERSTDSNSTDIRALFPLPSHVLMKPVNGSCPLPVVKVLHPGEPVVDLCQLGGWSLAYVTPLLHEAKRGNMNFLTKLVRTLRNDPSEAARLVAKALSALMLAFVTARNFYDTALVKQIQSVGNEVVRSRCADREMLRASLRFLEGEHVAQHVALLVDDATTWVDSMERLAAMPPPPPPEVLSHKKAKPGVKEKRYFSEETSDGRRASQHAAAVSYVPKPLGLGKSEVAVLRFLIDTLADVVPAQPTMDEVLSKPYEPVQRPPEHDEDSSESDSCSTHSSDADACHTESHSMRNRKRRHKDKEKKRKEKESKFDAFFRAIAIYREEDHQRGEIGRLESLHYANMEVRFQNGVRKLQRRLALRQRMGADKSSDDSDSSSSRSSGSSRGRSPPPGMDSAGLARWKAERKAAAAERRRAEKLKRRAVHGKVARYRKMMLETFPGGYEDLKAAAPFPCREVVTVRVAMGVFQLLEEERSGRARLALDEFESFSNLSVLFDTCLWEL